MMIGAIVNGALVLAGSMLGILFRRWISEELNRFLTQVLGVCVVFVGITSALDGERVIIAIISMVLGGIAGYAIDFDRRLNQFGLWVQKKLVKQNQKGADDNHFATGFVSATLLICVGAMAIVGSIQSGTTGVHEILLAKSAIDAIATLVMAATLGFGVCLSCIPVLIYEGCLTLLASFLAKYLTTSMMNEMTCVGGLIILMIGLNMMGLTKIKVANLLPAPFVAALLTVLVDILELPI